MDSYYKMWQKYAMFSGRTSRKDYWLAILVNAIIEAIIEFIGVIANSEFISFLCILYFIAIIIPLISMGVRRMHDINRNGCWILISLIPVIGTVWFLVLTIFDGNKNENEYGLPD